MDVLTAAWRGGAASDAPLPATEQRAECARCGATAGVVGVRSAVSKQFTAFDGWASPTAGWLCQVCAWGYSTPELRATPHVIMRQPVGMQQMDRRQVADLLQSGAVEPDQAVVVPLQPGRKHLLPTAVWGRVTVEDASLPWSQRDAELLGLVISLRRRGFRSRMLTEPAPPYRVLRTLPVAEWTSVMRAWEQLSCWREPDCPWLSLALKITTPKENR